MSDLPQEKLAAISRELDTIKFACSDLDRRLESLERENRSMRETVTTLKGTVKSQEIANSPMTSVETIQPELLSTLSKTVDAVRVHFQEEIDRNIKGIEAFEKNPASASAISGGDRRRHLESAEGVSRSSAPTLTSHDSSRRQEFCHLPSTSTAEILVIFNEEGDKQERARKFVLHNRPARLVSEVSESRDNGKSVVACFFDLSKAFDRVWHQGLLAKLTHLGVCEDALAWLSSYLTKRRQRVRVNSSLSPWLRTPAGVPQGSVLGPLLFLIYTIDLPPTCTNRSTTCSQFADDTALITTHESVEEAQDALQLSVTSAAKWLKDWHLLVNESKTIVMSFQRNHTLKITLQNTPLTQARSHRHLGLIIQADLRWTEHVDSKIKKARRQLFQLRRIRNVIHKSALINVYCSYVRPIVEYGSLVLSNLTQTSQDQLESLQRRAGRVCLGPPLFQPTHHSSLLHHLSIPTLSSRRHFRQLMLAHALLHGNIPPHLQIANLPNRTPHPYHNLRRPRTYAITTTRTTRHRDSPLNLAAHLYNLLPTDIISIVNPSAFKRAITPLILSSICSCSGHPDLH